MLKQIMKNLTAEKKMAGVPDFVIRNFLKEYLQYPVLQFIYNNPNYKRLVFTGGSCLRICYGAPRLSEDLDFDLLPKDYQKLKLEKLAKDLEKFFLKNYLLKIAVKCQGKTRVYLKFSLLKELGLAGAGESDWLYVKLEPSRTAFQNSETELIPVSQYGFNFLTKNYSLKFLMTGKIYAIFSRQWLKGQENKINIKGRDFYDIYWYFQKKVEPDYKNLKRLIGVSNKEELKEKLKERIEKAVTSKKLSYDLKNFFPDQPFIEDFCKNYKKIIKKYL
ncbi:nucleotidyl transferase AbiEii/AbiGii toxin family protein [Patescibacteria group bacterium]|nr:nucleotidyl transferase AbiEii/AbiGii toxin family protein [Patescibacteria group bacterium]MCG2693083.1 nucleotidyl transferase AbiEii/AbiGii toxin family protein [Candidatus Parcubacteria bacterium]